MKYLLSLTIYLDTGTALTRFKNDQLYPSVEACTAAGESWKRAYKENAKYTCQLVNVKNWE
jgi:hypothetical protein